MSSERYDKYMAHAQRLAAMRNFVKRNRIVLSIALVSCLAATGALMGTKGIVMEGEVMPEGTTITYGESPRFAAGSFMGGARYQYAPKGSDSWSYEVPQDAGEYQARAVGEGTFGPTYGEIHNFSIAAKTVEFKYTTDHVTYGEYPTIVAEGLLEGQKIGEYSSSYGAIEGNQTTMTLDSVQVVDAEGNDKSANYSFVKPKDVAFTLDKRTVTYALSQQNLVYNGEVQTHPSALTLTEGTLAFEDEVVYEAPQGLKTGVYAAEALRFVDKDGVDRTELYEVKGKLDPLLITKRALSLSTPDFTKVYDGAPVREEERGILSVGELASGDEIHDFAYDHPASDFVKVGVYSKGNSFTYTLDNADQYNLDVEMGDIVISPRQLHIEINGSWLYEGIPFMGDEASITLPEEYYSLSCPSDEEHPIPEGENLVITMTCDNVYDRFSSGSSLTFAVYHGEEDVTSNYSISCSGAIAFARAEVTLTGAEERCVYDGKAHTLAYEVSPLQGSDVLDLTMVGDPSESIILPGSTVGSFTAYHFHSETGVDRDNDYKLTIVNPFIVIEKRPLSIVLDAEFSYGGTSPYRALVEGVDFHYADETSLAEGDAITLTLKPDVLYRLDHEGELEKLTLDDFNLSIVHPTLGEVVEEAYDLSFEDASTTVYDTLTLTGKEETVYYDGSAHSLGYEYVASAADEFTVGFEGTSSIVKPGVISGTPYLISARNPLTLENTTSYYHVNATAASMTVQKRPITVDVDIQEPYSGFVHGLDLEKDRDFTISTTEGLGLAPGERIVVTALFDLIEVTPEHPMEYDFKVYNALNEDVTDCYDITLGKNIVNIEKADFMWHFEDEHGSATDTVEVVYDGASHYVSLVTPALQDGDHYEFTSLEFPAQSEAGEYVYTTSLAGIFAANGENRNAYYNLPLATQTITLKILARPLDLDIAVNRTYDGTDISISKTLGPGDYSFLNDTTLASGDYIAIVADYDFIDYDPENPIQYEFHVFTASGVNNDSNYDFAEPVIHAPIMNKATAAWALYIEKDGNTYIREKTYVYDGTSKNAHVDTTSVPTRSGDYFNLGYELTPHTESGVYVYTATFAAIVSSSGEIRTRYYEVNTETQTATLTIAARSIDVVISVNRVYDGSDASISPILIQGNDYTITNIASDEGLVSGQTLTITPSIPLYSNDLEPLRESLGGGFFYAITSGNTPINAGNYDLSIDVTGVSVTKKVITYQVGYGSSWLEDAPIVYDGYSHGFNTSYSVGADGDTIHFPESPSATKPTAEPLVFEVLPSDITVTRGQEDRTMWYTFTSAQPKATLTISKRPIDIQIHINRTYDGTDASISKTLQKDVDYEIIHVTADSGLAATDTLGITSPYDLYSEAMFASLGLYATYSYSLKQGNANMADCYEIVHTEALTFQSHKKAFSYTVGYYEGGDYLASKTLVYDGQAHSISVGFTGICSGDNFQFEEPESYTFPTGGAKTYTLSNSVAGATTFDIRHGNVSRLAYYTISTSQNSASLTINKRPITITVNLDREYLGTYDPNSLLLSPSVNYAIAALTPLADGDTISFKMTKDGQYVDPFVLYAAYGNLTQSNYAAHTEFKILHGSENVASKAYDYTITIESWTVTPYAFAWNAGWGGTYEVDKTVTYDGDTTGYTPSKSVPVIGDDILWKVSASTEKAPWQAGEYYWTYTPHFGSWTDANKNKGTLDVYYQLTPSSKTVTLTIEAYFLEILVDFTRTYDGRCLSELSVLDSAAGEYSFTHGSLQGTDTLLLKSHKQIFSYASGAAVTLDKKITRIIDDKEVDLTDSYNIVIEQYIVLERTSWAIDLNVDRHYTYENKASTTARALGGSEFSNTFSSYVHEDERTHTYSVSFRANPYSLIGAYGNMESYMTALVPKVMAGEEDVTSCFSYSYTVSSYAVIRGRMSWTFGSGDSPYGPNPTLAVDKQGVGQSVVMTVSSDAEDLLHAADSVDAQGNVTLYAGSDQFTFSLVRGAGLHKTAGVYPETMGYVSAIDDKQQEVSLYYDFLSPMEQDSTLTVRKRNIVLKVSEHNTGVNEFDANTYGDGLGAYSLGSWNGADIRLAYKEYDADRYYVSATVDSSLSNAIEVSFYDNVVFWKRSILYSLKNTVVGYDGAEHTCDEQTLYLPENHTIQFKPRTDRATNPLYRTEPGTYTIYSDIPDGIFCSEGIIDDVTACFYNVTESTATLTITKKELTITLSGSRTYNGELLSYDLADSEFTATGLASGQTLKITPVENTILTDKPISYTVRYFDEKGILHEADTIYTVNIMGEITYHKASGSIAGTVGETKDYNGRIQYPTITFAGGLGNDAIGQEGVTTSPKDTGIRNIDDSISYDIVSAKIYKGLTDVTKYYDLAFIGGDLTIVKGKNYIKLGDYTAIYDGSTSYALASYIQQADITIEPTLMSGHSLVSCPIVGVASVSGPNQTYEIGIDDVEFENIRIVDQYGNDVTYTYGFSGVIGSVKFVPLTVTVSSGSTSIAYDGQNHTISTLNCEASVDENAWRTHDYTVRARLRNPLSLTNVGVVSTSINAMTAYVEVLDESGNNFGQVASVRFGGSTSTLQILHRSITVSTPNIVGETEFPVTFTSPVVSAGTLAEGESLACTGPGKRTYNEVYVGLNDEWTVTVIKDGTGIDVTSNYKITMQYGTITIAEPIFE